MRANIIIILALVFGISCTQDKIDYEEIKTYQDNSVKKLLVKADSTTKVLLIFPHADDEIICVGLTAYLKEQGAIVHLLTLTNESTAEGHKTRLSELQCA